MTALSIEPQTAISTILLIVSFMGFIFTYNKAVRSRVNKNDLRKIEDDIDKLDCKVSRKSAEMKDYVDQQDRAIHHRITENIDHVSEKLDIIINKLK